MSLRVVLPLARSIAAAWFCAAATAAFAQCHFPANATGRVLTYTFDPTVSPAGTVLHVTLRFKGSAEGSDTVEVPSQWAGETLHGITNLRTLSAETSLGGASSPDQKTVRHPPGRDVSLAYDIVKDWTGRFNFPLQFHAVLLPQYLEINGANALVRPDISSEAPVTVHFDWRKLPAAWVLATSFGADAVNDAGRCQSYSGPWIAVEDALFTAGDFRIRHFQIGAQPALLLVRGQWSFTDDDAVAAIQKAVGIVRDFWHDHDFPYYVVTLKPYDNDKGQSDGSAFTNAFWLYLSRQDPLSVPVLATLVHETFHTWNPRRMGLLSNSDDHAIEWFREGFTQYYGYLLAYRAGLLQFSAYVDSLNRDLRDSPGSTNPYVRGRLIALWLDGQIRKYSAGKSSLDNVMYDMVSGASKPLTQARILETAARYLSPDSQNQLAAAVEHAVEPGARMPAAEDSLGACASGSIHEFATFDLGFDFTASEQAHKVVGVRPDGPADQAGLRDGQEMAGYSVYHDEPEKAAKITIRTGDTKKTIEYYPRGKPQPIMQYKPRSSGERCEP